MNFIVLWIDLHAIRRDHSNVWCLFGGVCHFPLFSTSIERCFVNVGYSLFGKATWLAARVCNREGERERKNVREWVRVCVRGDERGRKKKKISTETKARTEKRHWWYKSQRTLNFSWYSYHEYCLECNGVTHQYTLEVHFALMECAWHVHSPSQSNTQSLTV